MAADPAAVADRRARHQAPGRSPRHQRDRACPENRLPLVELSHRLRATRAHLQSLRALGAARHMGEPVSRACRERRSRRDAASGRRDPRQGAPEKQAARRPPRGGDAKVDLLAAAAGHLTALPSRLARSSTQPPARLRVYFSNLMLLSRITCAHRAISLFISSRPASGERSSLGKAATPSPAQILRIAGSATTSCRAALSLLTTASGVPLGAKRACQ